LPPTERPPLVESLGLLAAEVPLVTTPARVKVRANFNRTGRHARGVRRRTAETGSTGQRRLTLLLVAGPLVGGLTIGTALAQRTASVSSLSPVEAADQGTAISIVDHRDTAPGLVEVRVPVPLAGVEEPVANQLLAVSPGGNTAAVAKQIGPDPTTLVLAHADQSQLRIQMPGLIAAGFAPDGSWLAVVDGKGALWRVQADTGSATHLADGPFIGGPTVEAAGSILALRVSSVEAPFVSRLARVAVDGSATAFLSDDQLVYGAQPLADGSLAVIAHGPFSTGVWRLAGAQRRALVDLGQDAVNVAVAPAGDAVAWERSGEVFIQELPSGQPVRLASGTRPRFSADGRSVLVELPEGSALIGGDGRTIEKFASQAGFATCAEGC
jgi:hypothetical protein